MKICSSKNIPLINECTSCGRNTIGHSSQLCKSCRGEKRPNYKPNPGLEFGLDFDYVNFRALPPNYRDEM
jgi:hypothetical protein